MTDLNGATHGGRRVLKRVEPQQTIARLYIQVRRLHEEIQALLDQFAASDCKRCNIPEGVLRGMRLAPFNNRNCLCAWLKDEHENIAPIPAPPAE
jgi:hypothetical protein